MAARKDSDTPVGQNEILGHVKAVPENRFHGLLTRHSIRLCKLVSPMTKAGPRGSPAVRELV